MRGAAPGLREIPSSAALAARPWPSVPPRTPTPIAKPAPAAAHIFTSFSFAPARAAAAPKGWAHADVVRNVTTEAAIVDRPSCFAMDIFGGSFDSAFSGGSAVDTRGTVEVQREPCAGAVIVFGGDR